MSNNVYTLRNEDFIYNIDVICPKCKTKAIVLGGQPYIHISEYESEIFFSCKACGFALKYSNTPNITVYTNSQGKDITTRILFPNNPVDPFFGYEVWFCIETKYGVLWAYNIEHLTVIENYIAETLRSRNGIPYKNNSIGSRLPQWVKDSKNRDYLLKLITKMKVF